MFGLDYLLAAMLLQGAEIPSIQDADASPAWHAYVGKPMLHLALYHQLLDQREVRYVLAKSDEFISDLSEASSMICCSSTEVIGSISTTAWHCTPTTLICVPPRKKWNSCTRSGIVSVMHDVSTTTFTYAARP